MEDNGGGAAAPLDASAAAPVDSGLVDSGVEGSAEQAVKTPEQAVQEKKVEKQLKKLKLKVDGKEFEETFSTDDDEYLTRQLQLAKMGQKRAQELASLQREAREFIENLRKNPRAVLSDPNLGIDLKQIAAEMIQEEIENAKKSPDQLEKEKLQAELKKIKEDREKDKKDSESREYQRLVEENVQKYDVMIGDALEKTKLPSNPYTVKKMTDYLMLGIQNGIDVSPADVAKLVQQDMQDEIKGLMPQLSDDQVEELMGQETYDRIRKKKLAKSKATPKPPTPVRAGLTDTGSSKSSDKAKEKQTFKKFFGV